MNSSQNNSNFVSSREAAKLVGLTHDYIGRLCKSGQVIGSLVEGSWHVELNSLKDFLHKKEQSKLVRNESLKESLSQEYQRAKKQHRTTYTPLQRMRVAPEVFSRLHTSLPKKTNLARNATAATLMVVILFTSVGFTNADFAQFARALPAAASFPFTGSSMRAIASVFVSQPDRETSWEWFVVPRQEQTSVTVEPPAQPIAQPVTRATPQTFQGVTVSLLNSRLAELESRLVAQIFGMSLATRNSSEIVRSFPVIVETSSGGSDIPLPLAVISGGTGTSSSPTFGQILVGNTNGTYDLVATSSLGISGVSSFLALSDTPNSLATGDILYADAANSLAALPIGSNGQVLKIIGGSPQWSTDISGGGGSGAWATTSNDLAIYPSDTTDVVLIGTNATSTTGNIFEVAGNSLFRGSLTSYFNLTAPRFTATSSTASVFPYASSTAWSSSYASSTNLFAGSLSIGSLTGPLQAVNGLVSATSTLSILYGGTGTSTPPSYGRLLIGNNSGTFDYVATSSLGITSAVWGNITGTLANQTDLQNALDAKLSLTAWYATTTDGLDEGAANFYFTNARVQTYLDTITKGYFFSTTSADYWETQQASRLGDDLTNNSIEDLNDVAAMTENFGDLFAWNGSTWTDFATSSLAIALSDTTGTLGATRGGTGLSTVTAAGILLGNYQGTGWQQLATSTLGLLTTHVQEGSNLYFTSQRATDNFIANLAATTSIASITTLPNLAITSSQVSDFTTSVNSFIHSSTTVPKTYTTNVFTGNNTFSNATSSTFAITSLLNCDLKTNADGSVFCGTDATGSGGGASFGESWNIRFGALTPTTTLGILVSASSTIGNGTQAGGLTISGGATTTGNTALQGALTVSGNTSLTNATTSNFGIANVASALLSTNAQGTVVATTSLGANLTAGNWTGTFDGQEGSFYLDARNLTNFGTPFYQFFSATTTDALAQGATNRYYSDALVNTFIAGSSTIPKTYTINTFTGTTTFTNFTQFASASSTAFSALDFLAIGRTATTTIRGSATSTFAAGIQTTALDVTSSTATSTFANGIQLLGGCFRDAAGNCVGSSIAAFSIEDLSDVTTMTENFGDLLYWNGSAWADIATSSLGLLTTNIAEGSNLYFTTARVQIYLDTIAKGYFFSTTSADYWETQQASRLGDDLTNNSIEDLNDVAAMTENFGDLFAWNGSAWTDFATSSLAIALSDTTGTLGATRGGTGLSTVSAAGILIGNYAGTGWMQLATSTLGLLTTHISEGSNLYYTDARVNSFIGASSTIPKTYTSNTFAGAQTFSGSVTIGSLNGPLQANNGIVSATTSIGVLYGGTGLTTAPSYGQVLLGQSDGTYQLVATSSLGITSGGLSFAYPFPNNATTTLLAFNGGFTATNATTSNFAITNLPSALLTTNAQGTIVATSSLGITYGGTGATTASGARTNLGAAASGANTDITSLTGLSSVGIGTSSPYAPLSVVGQIVGAYITATTSATSTLPHLTGSFISGYGLGECSDAGDKLLWNNGLFSCGADAGAGGGITALRAQYSSFQTGSSQTFATSSDTNIGLVITSAGDTHTFTPTWSGTLAVGRGGTGQSTFTSSQLLYGNGTNALSSVATSSIAVSNGLTVTSGSLGYQISGSDVSLGLAAIAANSILANSSGAVAVPTALATSSLGIAIGDTTGTLAVNRGGTGLSSTPTFGQLLVGNSSGGYTLTATSSLGLVTAAVTAIGPTGQTADGPTVTIATSTGSFNGITTAITVVGSGDTLTLTPTLSGTLNNSGLTNSTISGIALGANLADLTAANGTLTFSGSYNGSTARTVGLNLGNTNSWTALQNFVNASSTLFSAGRAYFGETATTTIDAAGNVVVAGTLQVTGNTTLANATSTNLALTNVTNTLLKTNGSGSIIPAIAGTDYVTSSQLFAYPFPNNATTTFLAFNGGLSTTNASTSNLSAYTAAIGGTGTTTISATGAIAAPSLSLTNALTVANGGTGANTFSYGLIGSPGGTGALTNFATSSLGLLTTHVAEGSNLYFTSQRATDNFISNLAATTSVASITTLANLSITSSQVSNFNASVNSFIHSSTTIPKTYTANTFTALQTFGNASTSLLSTNYASSTLYYGANLANCTGNNVLTWQDGRFGCEADDTGSTFGYLFPNNATTTTLTFSGGLVSVGSTTINGNATTTGMFGAGSIFVSDDRITDFTGAGLTLASNALTVDNVTAAMLNAEDFGEFTCNGTNCSLDAESQAINELSDVTITAAAFGDLLMHNGTAWVDTATSTLGIALSDTTGTLAVNRGGTGLSSTPTFGQILVGNSSNGYTLTATSSLGLGTVTSVNASGGTTGLSFSGGPITSSGTLTLAGILNVANGGTGWAALQSGALLYGNGTNALATTSTGTAGNILALLGGVPTWTSTSSILYETELDTEAELETLLADVTNVFTNNDGALSDDDLTNNSIEDLNDVAAMTENFGDLFAWNGSSWTDFATSSLDLFATGLGASDFGDWTCDGNTCSIDADAVALATDTTGNYVATIAGTANQISVSGSGSENAAVTLSLPSLLALQQASSTQQSILDGLFVGRTSTTTILGSATSTFGAGIQTTALNVTSSSATSTFANGIRLTGGCIEVQGGCLGGSAVSTLDSLTDVDTTGVAYGGLIQYNGTSWIDVATSTLGIAIGDTTGTLAVNRGGTGLSSTPTFGQLLVGNASGGYTLTATSSLGLVTAAVTAIGPTGQTSDGPTVTLATTTSSSNGLTAGLTIVGSGDTQTFTPSLSGTLNNSGLTNSTISGIALGSNLADLTAANGTLTFSGAYNGGTARTIGLNLGNANTWTALQTFGNASTSLISASYASSTLYYGAGLANCASESMLTWTDGRFGCESDTSGLTAYDAWTHPAAGQSATTSLMIFTNGLIANASSTIAGGLTVSGMSTSTNLTITGVTGSLLKTNTLGQVTAAIAGTDYANFAYPFPNNATTSTLTITGVSTTNITASNQASTSQLVVSNSFTFANLTGFLKATAGVVATAAIDLANDVTGILAVARGGTGWGNIQANSIVLGNGTGPVATTSAGTNGQILALLGGVPTWVATTTAGTGLTYNGTSFNVNTSQNITTLSNLTTNGFVRTGSSNGTLSVQTDPIPFSMGGTGSTTAVVGQLLYGGSSAYQSVATSTLSVGNGLAVSSGSLGFQVGGSNVSLGLAAIAANSILANSSGAAAVPTALATSSLGIALGDTTGTLGVSRGGTGQTTFSSSQLLYGNGTNALSSVATSSVTAGTAISFTGTPGALVGGSALTVNFQAPASSALSIPFASTTMITATSASTTNLTISSLGASAGNCLTINGSGAVSTQPCSNFSYPFPNNATTSQLTISGGIITTNASTTNISGNTLAIGGTATTTIAANGNTAVGGTLNVTGQTTLATSLTGLLKATSGVVSSATAGVDYVSGGRDWNVVGGTGYLTPTTTLGVILGASSTINANATTTGMHGFGSIFLNSDRITDLTGSGLVLSSNALTVDDVTPGMLQAADFGEFTCNGTTCSLDADTVADSEIDYSQVTLADFTNDAGFSNFSYPFPNNATTSTLTITGASTTNFTTSNLASTSRLVASNAFTFSNVTGFLKATAGVVATAAIDLANDVTGILTTARGGTGWGNIQANTIVLGNGTGALATTSAGTNGQVLALLGGVPTWVATTTAGTGLTYTGSAFTVNTSQNITTLSNLTTNGFVRTGSSNGTLSVQTDPIPFSMGGTGSTTALVGQLLYGGSSAYQSVATSSLAVGNGLTVTSGNLGYQIGGSNASLGLAAIAANSVLANSSGGAAVPSAVSTTTIFGALGTPGQVLMSNGTGIVWAATSTCVQITGSAALCDGDDATGGGGGGSDPFTHPTVTSSATTSLMLLFGQASTTQFSATDRIYVGGTATTTIRGDNVASTIPFASSTALTVSGTASTSKFFADGLISCTSNNVLTWSGGTFGCEADDQGAGGSSGFPFMTVQGSIAAATSSRLAVFNDVFLGATGTTTFTAAGFVGIGTTSPYAKLSVVGEAVARNFTATSTSATSTFAGGLNVGNGALTHDFTSGLTSIENLSIGAMTFDTDAGIVSWTDMPVTSSASAGTVESYSAQIDGSPLLTLAALSDGAGSIFSKRVGIASSTPWGILSVDAGTTSIPAFVIGSSTATRFQISSMGVASSTGLVVSNLGGSGTRCVQTGADGTLSAAAAACGAGGGSFGQTWEVFGGSSGWIAPTSTLNVVIPGAKLAVASTSPWGQLSVGTHNLSTLTPSFVIASSSLTMATTTQFIVRNGFVGVATSSPWALLSIDPNVGLSSLVPAFAVGSSTNDMFSIRSLAMNNTYGTQFNFGSVSTTTIRNSTPFAWTIATSTTAFPMLRFDTVSGSTTIGLPGGDVTIGAVGRASNLVFEESSVIHAQGNGTMTFGSGADVINFRVNTSFGLASSTPWRALSVDGTVGFSNLSANVGAATASLCLSSNNEVTRNTDNETCITSSGRFKHDIVTLPTGSASELLRQFRPVTFEYNNASGTRYGFIAEEINELDPKLVGFDDQGLPNSVRYTSMVPLLVQAFQELEVKVDGLTGGLVGTGNFNTVNASTTNTSLLCLGGECRDAWGATGTSTLDLSAYATRVLVQNATSSLTSQFGTALGSATSTLSSSWNFALGSATSSLASDFTALVMSASTSLTSNFDAALANAMLERASSTASEIGSATSTLYSQILGEINAATSSLFGLFQSELLSLKSIATTSEMDITPLSATTSALELVNASSTATTTPWVGSFASASQGLKDGILSLADTVVHVFTRAFYATVGVFEKVFAREVHTDTLCVSDDTGETCITKGQLDALLAGAAASQGEEEPPAAEPEPVPEPTASSTPPISEPETETPTEPEPEEAPAEESPAEEPASEPVASEPPPATP